MPRLAKLILLASGVTLFPGAVFAANADLPTIYAFVGGNIMADVLEGVGRVVGSDSYRAVMVMIAMLGLLVAGIYAVRDPRYAALPIRVVFTVALLATLLTSTTQVRVVEIALGEDTTDGFPETTITMPTIVALPMSLFSSASYHLTSKTEEALWGDDPQYDSLKITKGGFGFGMSLLRDANTVMIADSLLADAFGFYSRDCVMVAVASGDIEPEMLIESSNFLTDLGQAASPSTLTFDPIDDRVATCEEAYDSIVEYLDNNTSPEAMGALLRMGGSAWLKTSSFESIVNALDDVLRSYSTSGGMPQAGSTLLQRALISEFTDVYSSNASLVGVDSYSMSVAAEQAKQGQVSSWVLASDLFHELVGYVFAALQAFVAGIVIFVIVLLLIPGVGGKVLTNYFFVLAFVFSWELVLAINNYLVFAASRDPISMALAQTGAGALTLDNSPIITEATSRFTAASGFFATLSIFVTWKILQGVMAFTEFLGEGLGTGAARSKADVAASGNITVGSQSYGNITAHNLDLAHKYESGVSANNSLSSLVTHTGAGGDVHKVNDRAINPSTTVTSSRSTSWSEGLKRGYSKALSVAKQVADSAAFSSNRSDIRSFLRSVAGSTSVSQSASGSLSASGGENLGADASTDFSTDLDAKGKVDANVSISNPFLMAFFRSFAQAATGVPLRGASLGSISSYEDVGFRMAANGVDARKIAVYAVRGTKNAEEAAAVLRGATSAIAAGMLKADSEGNEDMKKELGVYQKSLALAVGDAVAYERALGLDGKEAKSAEELQQIMDALQKGDDPTEKNTGAYREVVARNISPRFERLWRKSYDKSDAAFYGATAILAGAATALGAGALKAKNLDGLGKFLEVKPDAKYSLDSNVSTGVGQSTNMRVDSGVSADTKSSVTESDSVSRGVTDTNTDQHSLSEGYSASEARNRVHQRAYNEGYSWATEVAESHVKSAQASDSATYQDRVTPQDADYIRGVVPGSGDVLASIASAAERSNRGLNVPAAGNAQQKIREGLREIDDLGRQIDSMDYVSGEMSRNRDALDQRGTNIKSAVVLSAADQALGAVQRVFSAMQRKESLDEIKRDYSISREELTKVLETAGIRVGNLDFDSISTKEGLARAVFSQSMGHIAQVADMAGDDELAARARSYQTAMIHSPEQAQNIITDLTDYINNKYARR